MKEQEVILNQKNEPTEVVAVPQIGDRGLITIDNIEELENQLAKIKAADVKNSPEAGIKYWEAGKGDELRGIFVGWKTFLPKDAEECATPIPAAVIRVDKYLAFMSGAVQLTSAFMNIAEGSGVFVKCDEAKSGSAKSFTVKVIE